MRRPALHALLLFVAGILLGNVFDLPVNLLISILALTLSFCVLFLLRKEAGSVRLFLILAIILAGFSRYELLTRDLPKNHVSNFLSLNSKVTITGKIVEEPDVRKNKTFITLGTEQIAVDGRIYRSTGRIVLKIREPVFRFDYADRIQFEGYLNQPSSKRNPGAFDYKRYLNRKRIYGIVSMSGADQIGVLDHAQGNILHSGIVIPLRRWTLGVFNSTLSGNHKALLSGFLLGETRDIPKRVYDMFRDTGTVHLLAVSGSNVWLVIGVILGALSLLRVPRFPATLLGLVCIFVFANLVHNDPPVVRAGIMAAVMLVGVLLYRDVDLVNVVSFSGLVILLYSPLFLFDVGFQLSFASVFAILLLYPRLSELVLKYVGKSHRKLWKWIIMPALISVSVELVLFPILAYYFNMIPLIIVVANIFIVPLAGLSVVLACFTLFSAVFSSGLAGIFSACNWLCLDLTLRLTEFFANLPVAKLSVPAPSVSTFMVYYFFLWLLVSSIASKRKTIVFSVLIIANLFVWREGLAHRDAPLKLTILDVSQGSCAVLDLPNGQTFLLNVGQKAKNFDAGEYAVIPYLNHKGTAKIDKLILTDTDSSSLNSVGSVLKEVDVERILLSDFAPWGQKGDVYPVARESSQVQSLESLRAITDEKGEFEIRFFQYPKSRRPKLISDEMLTLIRYRDIAFCLFDGMKRVHFNPEFDWDNVRDCSVLVLSELGDANEIVQVISAIRPQKLLFTRHYFRHEKNKIPLLMQQNFPGIEYYRTAENGAITCETDGERLRFDLTIR